MIHTQKGAKARSKDLSVRKKQQQFDIDEIYRQLRTNIEFAQIDEDLNMINVVSTFPNEGKSTVAQNLARIYGARYKKVLLIDCDLRNPSIHKMLQLTNRGGLSDILGSSAPQKALMDHDEIKNIRFPGGEQLYVITAGHRVPNPVELLSSRRFADLLKKARKEFDFVILDCPPLAQVSDAIPVCNLVDGSLYVISARETDKKKARSTIQYLERNGGRVLGLVLTKVEETERRRYGYGYGYGYGEPE